MWPQNEVSTKVRCGDDARRPQRDEDIHRCGIVSSLRVLERIGSLRWNGGVGDTGGEKSSGLVGLDRGSVTYLTIKRRERPGDGGLLTGVVD